MTSANSDNKISLFVDKQSNQAAHNAQIVRGLLKVS